MVWILWATVVTTWAIHTGLHRWKRVHQRSTRTTGTTLKPAPLAGASPDGYLGPTTLATTASSRSMPSTVHAFGETSTRYSTQLPTSLSPTPSGERQDGDHGDVNHEPAGGEEASHD